MNELKSEKKSAQDGAPTRRITAQDVERFRQHLQNEERSAATVEKYLRDVLAFYGSLTGGELDKSAVLMYKEGLLARYAPSSVNSILSSLNAFFRFMAWCDCQVKTLKIQRQIFAKGEKELTRPEYERLVKAAWKKGDRRLSLLMQTICATGIRISELRYITCEAVNRQQAVIRCKGKMRLVLLPKQLCRMLKEYLKEHGIKSGSVFQTRSGNPLDRSNVWKMMKSLCRRAGVAKEKVFPHNLRHLFARTYYARQKDVVRLADILGHSSINTTRLYTMESGTVHRQQIQELGLLIC